MTTKRLCIFLFTMLFLITGASAETFNVKKYGARGNGKKLDSPAIQKAIDACHKAGGGTVLVPAGTYLSATIVLKDNVTLHLEIKPMTISILLQKAWELMSAGHCWWLLTQRMSLLKEKAVSMVRALH